MTSSRRLADTIHGLIRDSNKHNLTEKLVGDHQTQHVSKATVVQTTNTVAKADPELPA